MNGTSPLAAALLLAALLLGGCASSQKTELTNPEGDPWEPFNRKVHAFNMTVDEAVLRPVARGYDWIMPDAPQRGVRNFFRNLGYPVTFINLLLQGKLEEGMTATGRFLMNSSLGLLGFFDVATKVGIKEFDEDLGQTLAVWGWKDSRYLVVPFLGPFTVRDLLGGSADSYVDPVSYVAREEDNYVPLIVDLITRRAELLPLQPDLDAAADPYLMIRDVHLQGREFDIYDGNPPVPDYDALLKD
ncbi:MAG: VacJ family lipoprotein [Xanthomonadales bacterium]|nr:VacJ family lipoprotein [Xanthomonadales bacterium]